MGPIERITGNDTTGSPSTGPSEVAVVAGKAARAWFYWPMYGSGTGQVVALARPREPLSDTLAVALIFQQFSPDEHPHIVIEPSRPSLQPEANVVFVGRLELFGDPDGCSRGTPLSMGKDSLGPRLQAIKDACCFELHGGERREVLNRITGEVHRFETRERLEIEFGVIRRFFRGAGENTVTVEGPTSLGTLAAAIVATTPMYLDVFRKACDAMPGRDERRPIEILVAGVFNRESAEGVYSLDKVRAFPVAIVYDRRWLYRLMPDRGRWVDQRPWNVQLWARGSEPARPVATGRSVVGPPRLEIRGDIGRTDVTTSRLCRKLARRPGSMRPEEVDRLLEILTPRLADFEFELHREGLRPMRLPQSCSEARLRQKKFLIHLVFRRVAGQTFACNDETIQRFFPDFQPNSAKSLRLAFQRRVTGKLRECFGELLGHQRGEAGLMQTRCAESAYSLVTQPADLVLRLRL